jgi:hypothetical protein
MSDGILQEDWERYDAAMAADGNMNGVCAERIVQLWKLLFGIK